MEPPRTADLTLRLSAAAARAALWRPGARLVVAVSGGADSTALLHLLRHLAPEQGLQLAVAHVDHAWRSESAADAAWVGSLAADLGLPFHVHRLPATAATGNREQQARRAREAWFASLLAAGAGEAVATAHTRDDQAETVLLRLLRGVGPAALAGIAPVRPLRRGAPGRLIRPALALGRAELRAWLTAQELPWREDATNLRLDRARNRVRHSLLPWLALEFNPRLAEALARLADVAQAENAVWDALLAPLATTLWQPLPGGGWRAPRAALLAHPLGLQRRLVRLGLDRAGDRGGDFAFCDTLLRWTREAAPRRRLFRRGALLAVVTPGGLELRPAAVAAAPPEL